MIQLNNALVLYLQFTSIELNILLFWKALGGIASYKSINQNTFRGEHFLIDVYVFGHNNLLRTVSAKLYKER